MKPKTARAPRLKLSAADLNELKRLKQQKLSARTWRRILTLEQLDKGLSVLAAARAVGGYHREVKRVSDRYNTSGLEAALADDPRPGGERKLDSVEEAAIVALVCGPPPDGNARWTIRLVTSEVMKRGIVKRVGRETVRVTLAEHDLKPWREKNVGGSGDQRRVRRKDGGRASRVRATARSAAAGGLPR
ncbi:MAG: helix-turn-helix domain-containing protein [Kofleriaceae bacterium]